MKVKVTLNCVLSAMAGAVITTDQRDSYIKKLELETSNFIRLFPYYDSVNLSKKEVDEINNRARVEEIVRQFPELADLKDEAGLAGQILRKKRTLGKPFDEAYRNVCGMLQSLARDYTKKTEFDFEFEDESFK